MTFGSYISMYTTFIDYHKLKLFNSHNFWVLPLIFQQFFKIIS